MYPCPKDRVQRCETSCVIRTRTKLTNKARGEREINFLYMASPLLALHHPFTKNLLKMKSLPLVILLTLGVCSAYSPCRPSRRDVLSSTSSFVAIAAAFVAQPTIAFDGTGSSAYSGKNPTTKAALVKSYKARIAADVRDFNALGAAISKGKTEGSEWVSFFIQYARREPDEVGRTYAAQADLMGTVEGGGCGYLLATSFGKPNKPPDNVAAVKTYNALSKAFSPIQSAGLSGDAEKALKEFQKTKVLLSDFLLQVEMPASLDDPLYQ